MKIAVVGCGAVGSYYGARLRAAGHDVHFLLRSDYDAVQVSGVQVVSADGDFTTRPKCARNPKEIGVVDLVVIGLKTTANGRFADLVSPLVGPSTAVLTLQNGLGNEAQLAALFGKEKVLGGLCFVCLNRIAPGKIQHIAHGTIVMGEFAGPALPRTHAIAEAIEQSGVPCKVTDVLEQAHWEKLVWNVPFNGLGVAGTAGYDAVISGNVDSTKKLTACLTTDILLADPCWAKLVRELMEETIRAAQALGLAVKDSAAQKQIDRTLEMGAYRASTLIDFERGQELELDSLFFEPLRQARKAGIATPRLEAMSKVLAQINPHTPKSS
ncbi:MAG: 2-dehydropantoate 2-reductase [Limisphaerales bacterium]